MVARKLTLRARQHQVVFRKGLGESLEHVLMKAALWALHLPEYPELQVETSIGDRFKPDVVALDADGRPRFWGEAGQVTPRKIESIVRRFPDTRLVIARWGTAVERFAPVVQRALRGRGSRQVELLGLPADRTRYVDDDGEVVLTESEVVRLAVSGSGGSAARRNA